MKKQLSTQDWQALSALLDGELSPQEISRLEARLSADVDLREALESLRRTRILLRNSPKIRAPHNFTLTRQMVGAREKQRSSLVFPLLKFGTALASIFFIFALLGDFFIKQPMPMASYPAEKMVLSTEAPPMPAPELDMAAISPTMTPMAENAPVTEATNERSAELSNAPMEPLPSTIPSMLKVAPSPTLAEAPSMVAMVTEETNILAQEAMTASIQEAGSGAGAAISITSADSAVGEAAPTESAVFESPVQPPAYGLVNREEAEKPNRVINFWRILEIIFGSLVVILGISAAIYGFRKKT
jgi:hypothetical protein